MIETTPAAPHDAAPPRTDADTQQLVLQIVAREAESLLRLARRHSLCADDAHDAYQRSMEILVRRAPTLDPARASRWVHVVVKHEAMALRKRRSEVVSPEEVDFERHEAIHAPSPEEQAIGADRTARAAEALQRLKPHELQAMWLKALGKSYAEICDETGWTHTKLNRCLAEGRKTFLQRFAGIEAGEECERWQPALSALVDGEADAAAVADLRPHLRNCPSCRATLRALHEARAPLAAVLPVGLLGAGAKLSGLLERVLPGGSVGDASGGARLGGLLERLLPTASAGDAGLASGGAGLLGVGGTKLAGLVAAGAAVTAGGGGLVIAHEHRLKRVRPDAPVEARRADVAAVAVADRLAAAATGVAAPPGGAGRPADAASRDAAARAAAAAEARQRRRAARLRLAARRRQDGRVEFAPAGGEGSAPMPTSAPIARASVEPGATARPAPSAPQPVAPPAPPTDSTSGEFAPAP